MLWTGRSILRDILPKFVVHFAAKREVYVHVCVCVCVRVCVCVCVCLFVRVLFVSACVCISASVFALCASVHLAHLT
jgi:hypothetical protein